jgi:hypothetical protein
MHLLPKEQLTDKLTNEWDSDEDVVEFDAELAPCDLVDVLLRAFGKYPITLRYSDLHTLQILATTQDNEFNAYNRLASMIRRWGDIEITID